MINPCSEQKTIPNVGVGNNFYAYKNELFSNSDFFDQLAVILQIVFAQVSQ